MRLGSGGWGMVKLLAATAAVLAGCGLALVAVGGGRASDLVQMAKPGRVVRYMYVPAAVANGEMADGALVPGLRVMKAYAGQKGVQRMIPINELKTDPTQPAYLSVSVPLTNLAANDTNATASGAATDIAQGAGGNEVMKTRSCAISSLVEQAKAIFPEWDKCGYKSEWSSVASESNQTGSMGVISGPSDDAACG